MHVYTNMQAVPVIIKKMQVVKASDWMEKHPKAGNRGLVFIKT